MKRLVMKFGGTSVGSVEALRAAANIVHAARREWQQVVVVTSAMSGITDLLLEQARRAASGDITLLDEAASRLLARHDEALHELIGDAARQTEVSERVRELTSRFVDLCQAIAVLGEATPRALDAVASLGERMSAPLLAAVLEEYDIPSCAVDASAILVTDERFQNAHPDLEQSRPKFQAALLPLLEEGQTPVVTGFIGASPQGVVTTLGRGGSDYSAALLGILLPADDVWIWTDVNGVLTADPRLVPQARTLPEISYREMAELAYYGAKVLHPKTIRPLIEAGIGLRICNTFNPSHPGTRVYRDEARNNAGLIRAVTAIPRQRLVVIEGRGMMGVPGVAARVFAAVASTETSVPLITQASSEQSICFAVPGESASVVLDALEKAFALELMQRDIDRIWAGEEVAILTVVGAGIRDTPGIAGQVFGRLGIEHINVLAIAHGSTDVSVSMVVDHREAARAVSALHQLIEQEESQ
ncbi:MAG: aspartate kinase [Chloroflexota bacterium]